MAEPDRCHIAVSVNGVERSLAVAADETLLDVLRDRLGLTGTKRGCDRGACGTCTVLSDGRAINACLLLAPMADGARIVTIEGLGTDGRLHALQQAFVEHDALQCGFCTPGQILAAIGLLERRPSHRRAPRSDERQSLPLRGVPEHHRGDRIRHGGAAMSACAKRPGRPTNVTRSKVAR